MDADTLKCAGEHMQGLVMVIAFLVFRRHMWPVGLFLLLIAAHVCAGWKFHFSFPVVLLAFGGAIAAIFIDRFRIVCVWVAAAYYAFILRKYLFMFADIVMQRRTVCTAGMETEQFLLQLILAAVLRVFALVLGALTQF